MSKTLKYSCKINVIENLQNIVLTIEMNWDRFEDLIKVSN